MQNIKRRNGITLIELLIVVAIIGILAAIAYPSYTQSVLQGRRAEGRAFLLDAAARLESFYSNTNTYASAANTLPFTNGIVSESNLYNLTIQTISPYQTYTLSAAPTFADAGCGTLTLTESGVRGRTGTTAVADCWR